MFIRSILLVASAALSAFAAAEGRIVILGFDGVDPDLVQTMLDAGELPNLKAVAEEGVFTPLESSNPPQSPTAWSSFITSRPAGGHGVYDFVKRNPRTYAPMVGFGQPVHAQVDAQGQVTKPAAFVTDRQGDSFWSVADKGGKRCKILSVPFAYPAESLEHGCMLCGLGVPDIRGTQSTFFYFSDAFTDAEMADRLSGGERIQLAFDGDTAAVKLPGARDVAQRGFSFVEAPVSIKADRAAKSIVFSLPGNEIALKEGEWSGWIEWSFEVTPSLTVQAISRIHLLECGEQVRLYMTCLQMNPRAQYIPMTAPESYGAELADRYGLFKTIGWIYDTHAMRQNVLPEDLFLEDVERTMSWREQLTLDEIDRGDFDLLVSAWTATDRVAHLFWAHRDPEHPAYTAEGAAKYGKAVESTYQRMDAIVGKVRAKLNPEDTLLIMSDHGFHSFRREFNVNTWLIREGYLAVAGQTDPATAFSDERYLQGFDWTRSKAYSVGLGGIYLNLKGREGRGIVEPGDADALMNEIREKLLALTDPKTGDKVFTNVFTRDIFQGAATADAPDLQLGYAEGYQSSKDAAAGAAPKEVFADNMDKWSGEHAASDPAFTQGILFSNKPIAKEKPSLLDFGPTALTLLGVPVPPAYEGASLF